MGERRAEVESKSNEEGGRKIGRGITKKCHCVDMLILLQSHSAPVSSLFVSSTC